VLRKLKDTLINGRRLGAYPAACSKGSRTFPLTMKWPESVTPPPRPLQTRVYRIQKFPDGVITKYTFTTINTRWEATQRVMAAKLTRLTHKIAIQLHLVAESCIICSSRSRRPVRKLLDTPSSFYRAIISYGCKLTLLFLSSWSLGHQLSVFVALFSVRPSCTWNRAQVPFSTPGFDQVVNLCFKRKVPHL
jgi:hypothetical protein